VQLYAAEGSQERNNGQQDCESIHLSFAGGIRNNTVTPMLFKLFVIKENVDNMRKRGKAVLLPTQNVVRKSKQVTVLIHH
jgi:hypothetical protein